MNHLKFLGHLAVSAESQQDLSPLSVTPVPTRYTGVTLAIRLWFYLLCPVFWLHPRECREINNNWFWKARKGGWNSGEEQEEDRDREVLAGRCETLSVYACAGTAKGRRRMNLRVTTDYEVSRPHSYSGQLQRAQPTAAEKNKNPQRMRD